MQQQLSPEANLCSDTPAEMLFYVAVWDVLSGERKKDARTTTAKGRDEEKPKEGMEGE